MGRIVGIDLGTTNSVVAVVEAGHPRVLVNRSAKSMTRSVVSLRTSKKKGDGESVEVLVGDVAMSNWAIAPEDTILSIKRLMGRAVTDEEVLRMRQWADYAIVEPSDGTKDSVKVVMGDREYSPVEISGKILRRLKEDAEYRLGEQITHAVITVPAYFSQIQRAATRKAGMMAGLKIVKILEEPTAAAIAFGVDADSGSDPQNLLVYDLGGGTFDISVLMWAGNTFVPLDLEGDMWLGGDDFDRLLVDHAMKHIHNEHGIDPGSDKPFMAVLRRAAQETKERLGATESAYLVVPNMLRDDEGHLINVELEVTREEFEQMIAPLVTKTIGITEKAIEISALTCDQVNHVLMVGNSTCIPMIQKAMEQMFGADKIRRNVHPKHCVAIGAAILAHRLGGIVCQAPDPANPKHECGHVNKLDATVCDKCGELLTLDEAMEMPVATQTLPDVSQTERRTISLPLGIAPFAYGTQTAGDVFNVFVNKGDPYPTVNPQPQTFYTLRHNQRMISIPVYGGDDLENASTNEKQGEAFAVLPFDLAKGTVIRVTLWLDDDGCFKVAAHLDDGTDLGPWITEGGEDARAIEAIQEVRKRLAKVEGRLAAEDIQELESAKADAFKQMKLHDFKGALALAQKAAKIAENAGRQREEETLANKADRLIGYAEFVVQEYTWALDSNYVLKLASLADQTRWALRSKEMEELEQKVQELDELTDHVPQLVKLLLGLKSTVLERIHPTDLAMAQSFMNEIEEVEQALRTGDSGAAEKLEDIAARLYDAMQLIESAAPKADKCGVCGAALAGQRCCPVCDTDQLLLESKRWGTGAGA
ncbi:MAG: Hsp70 family protein [Phycisphaerae bacterium]|nr:Hsp70 family protein [Phycisphaerae bacterium]